MDTNTIAELKSKIEAFKKRYGFEIEKKIVGKKEFETYLVKDFGPEPIDPAYNYIRVTHPLGYWVPPAFKAWLQNTTKGSAEKKMNVAANIGSKIHEYIETVFFHQLDVTQNEWIGKQGLNGPDTIAVKNGIDAFCEFWSSQNLTVIAQELKVFSKTYGFAGTIDMVAVDETGQVWVIDWKSGWYKPTYGWQCAAYGLAFQEHFGIEPRLMAALLDKRSGKATGIRYEHNSHLQACYLGVLQAFAGENWKALGEFWPWNLTEFDFLRHQKTINLKEKAA